MSGDPGRSHYQFLQCRCFRCRPEVRGGHASPSAVGIGMGGTQGLAARHRPVRAPINMHRTVLEGNGWQQGNVRCPGLRFSAQAPVTRPTSSFNPAPVPARPGSSNRILVIFRSSIFEMRSTSFDRHSGSQPPWAAPPGNDVATKYRPRSQRGHG